MPVIADETSESPQFHAETQAAMLRATCLGPSRREKRGTGMREPGRRASTKPTQFEQENDLGCGGGEVDDETLAEAWREAEERRSTANLDRESQD
jgi:hypothetical protein